MMTTHTPDQKYSCNGQALSRFIDGELTGAEQRRLEHHLTHCPDCQTELNRIRLLANTYQSIMDTSRFQKDLAGIEGRVMGRIKRPKAWRDAVWDFLKAKQVLIPVSAVGTILAVFVTIQMFFTAPTGPSAIVTSMTGDVSSVMIMETPQSRQTIIWITEDS
jgi:predicted anti-sigma-YlaC factor YlaD